MPETTQTGSTPRKRAKLSQTEFPNSSLENSLRIAQALWDHFAGRSAAPHDLAIALDLSPTSGGWRNLCGSSIAYGFTEGGYAAPEISLTDLGHRIVAPTEDGDDITAKFEAIVRPRIMQEFFLKYDKGKFPRNDIAKNVLVSLGLPKERADRSYDILEENGRYVGVIRETKTGLFVVLASLTPRPPEPADEVTSVHTAVVEDDDDTKLPPAIVDASVRETKANVRQPDGPKQIFVAHGKNRKPLEDLKKILDKFKIPYKVAVDEPHAGRPISKKVAELMKACSAGIFIFTRDEKFVQEDGEEIWRPSENVIYELGAASILWEKKIIILRESGVNFPSDFSDIGYITFEDGQIASKGLEIFGEFLALEFVKVQAA